MKVEKVRHQLYLPKDLSDRLAAIARRAGSTRSQILVDAVSRLIEAPMSQGMNDALAARLTRLERHIEAVRRHQGLQWEVLARIMRFQMIASAGLPRPDAADQALAAKAFEDAIDEIAGRLAGRPATPAGDRAIDKVRQLI